MVVVVVGEGSVVEGAGCVFFVGREYFVHYISKNIQMFLNKSVVFCFKVLERRDLLCKFCYLINLYERRELN